MIKYFRHSEISFRLGLNPFYWVWIPGFKYEEPSPFYPKRRTFAIAWLGLQAFLDIDNGETDLSTFASLINGFKPEIKDEDDREVGQKVSPVGTGSVDLE